MKKLAIIFLMLTAQCFGFVSITNSFNSGELTPWLDGQTGIKQYFSGCRTLENMIVMPHGGVTRRPGSRYIATAKSGSVACRLVSFEYSTTQAYGLEFGNLYLRFYKDGGQILNDAGTAPYEIVTTYETADLFGLQFIQSADTMYIVHPDHKPRVLTRTGHAAWTINDITFERGPFLNVNATAITITPSATTGAITLTASDDVFDALHVGALWEITHIVDAVEVAGSFTGTGNSTSVTVQLGRTIDYTTHGIWEGTVILQRSFDAGSNWQDVLPVHYNEDGNVKYSDAEDIDDAIYRVSMTVYTSGTLDYSLRSRTYELDGVVEITAVASATSASATVVNELGDTSAVVLWSEGAWSDYQGWPATTAFYQERNVYGGTARKPQTVWFSKTDDWPDFKSGDLLADEALSYTIAADQVNAIRWLMPQSQLLIGTTGGEWSLGPGSEHEALTATSQPIVKRHSTYGSADLDAKMVNNVVLYTQRHGRKIREMVYSFAEDNFQSPDMTVLAEHITRGGLVQLAYQKAPYSILWCVRADGQLLGFSYLREQLVTGWHRHLFDGEAESVAVIPGDGEDEVWISVKRTINGSDVRYIEQIQPFDWGDDDKDIFFVDSGLSFDGGASVTITAISSADPGVVTAAAHGFSDGDQVRIFGVVGMTEVNEKVFTVDAPATNSFSLRDKADGFDWDTSGYTTYSSAGTVTNVENNFTTLSHLEGETVDVVGDGGFVGTATVASSTVTLDDYYNTVHIGLNYVSRVKPMRLEIPGGQSQARIKRIIDNTVRMYKTLTCKVGESWTNYDTVIFTDPDDPLDQPPPMGDDSFDKLTDGVGGWETDGNITIQATEPLPMTILAIIPDWEMY